MGQENDRLLGNMLLLGSAWSPPGLMKQNNNLRWEYRDSYVNYWVDFLQMYRDNGTKDDAIPLQNEPPYSAPVSGDLSTWLHSNKKSIFEMSKSHNTLYQ